MRNVVTGPDLERLDKAIWVVARLIDESGEDFWPILDRLEAERQDLHSRQDRLDRLLSQKPPVRH